MEGQSKYANKVAHRKSGVLYHTSPFRPGTNSEPDYRKDMDIYRTEKLLSKFSDRLGTSLDIFGKKEFRVIDNPGAPNLEIQPKEVVNPNAYASSWENHLQKATNTL